MSPWIYYVGVVFVGMYLLIVIRDLQKINTFRERKPVSIVSTSGCPHCGAPVFVAMENRDPKPIYICDCRVVMMYGPTAQTPFWPGMYLEPINRMREVERLRREYERIWATRRREVQDSLENVWNFNWDRDRRSIIRIDGDDPF